MPTLRCALLLALPCLIPAPLLAASCESLAALALPAASITLAEAVPAGGFAAQSGDYGDLGAFCRVAATLRPSADSEIGIEVWLPARDWNGKFQGVGNGAWLGSISTSALADALRRGYAAASTDTGHAGNSASFALGHPEKLADFGYRAVHEMTVAAKAIVAAYHDGRGPRQSYFVGCSAGGRQGMKEAQRYPEDYDGIVAGAPGLNWSGRALQTVWVGQAVAAAPIPPEKFAAINAAALAACDEDDGVADGVIGNPRRCAFDPAAMQCAAGDGADCLTPAQVDTARRIYGGVVHGATGEVVVAGLSPGSENGWNTMAGPRPFGPGVDLFRYVVFADPAWDFRRLGWTDDLARTRAASASMDALDTNLTPFFARGGRIVSYHGWSDPQISPGSTVDYYESVEAALGAATVHDHYRLFMVPGMNHCGGGSGTDRFDMLSALENWVERGEAPDVVPAARELGPGATRTRPLCPWPQEAVYDGTGSSDASENFSCR